MMKMITPCQKKNLAGLDFRSLAMMKSTLTKKIKYSIRGAYKVKFEEFV